MSFKKNTAVNGFTVLMLDSSGVPVTTGTTNGFVTGDNGTQTALTNSVIHKGNGQWTVNLTAGEFNFDNLGLLFTNTAAISVNFTISTDVKIVNDLNDLGGVPQSADNDIVLQTLPASLANGTAQGGTSSTIQLASSETFATNELRGNVVKITGGTGSGQSRWINANVGITDTCTITPDWITTPDATSVYDIVQGSASMQAILDADLNESTDGIIANNFDTFFDNKNTNTIKTLDDIGTASPLPTSGWVWSTATSGVPITGRLRGNNATIASITELSIHEVSDAGKNTSLTISSLRSGDKVQVSFETNPDIFLIFNVTSTPILTGDVYAITGTVDTTAGVFTNTKVSVSYLITSIVTVETINDDAITAASIDDNALDGKGDWNTVTPDNAGITANGVAIGNLVNISPAQVNAEMLDVLVTDTFAEVTVPASTASIKDMIHYTFSRVKNKTTQTATDLTLRNDADSGNLGTATVSDDGTTFTKGKET